MSLAEVYKELDKCPAGFKLLLVDACRNDPQTRSARSQPVADLESVTRPQAVEPPGGVSTLFNCSASERAFENDELRHGVFFHFAIEGLKGIAAFDEALRINPELALA
jgi:hypothetical protein